MRAVCGRAGAFWEKNADIFGGYDLWLCHFPKMTGEFCNVSLCSSFWQTNLTCRLFVNVFSGQKLDHVQYFLNSFPEVLSFWEDLLFWDKDAFVDLGKRLYLGFNQKPFLRQYSVEIKKVRVKIWYHATFFKKCIIYMTKIEEEPKR